MKRIKWLMLLCAFAIMFAVPACGETTYVNSSAELIAAIKNPASGDIILSGDTTDFIFTSKDKGNKQGAIEISRDVSIDLNGHNIIATNVRALHVMSGDVTIYGEGVISATSTTTPKSKDLNYSSSVIRVGWDQKSGSKSKVKLTIEKDVTVSTDHCFGVTIFGSNDIDGNLASSDIEFVLNGKVRSTAKHSDESKNPNAAVANNGRKDRSAAKVTINGEIYSEYTYGIYYPGRGTLTINGTVVGGIEIKAGDAIVGNVIVNEGAKITARKRNGNFVHKENGDGNSTEGFAVAAVNNSKYYGNVNFNISNGAVIDGYIIAISDDAKSFDNIPAASADKLHDLISKDLTLYPNIIHITGGVFSRNPKTFEAVSPDVSKDVIYVSSDYVVIPLSHDTYNYGVVASTFKPALSIDVNGEISSDYSAVYSKDQIIKLTAMPTTLQSFDIAYKSYKWTKSGDATVSADTKAFVLDGLSTDSGTYTCVVTLSLDDKVLSADATVKITITETVEENDDDEDEAITLSASSTDVTVYQGGSIDITVTATTSGDNIVWTTSGDLPSGVTATKSSDKVYTITGKVADSADVKAYTYKVIASNDTNVASVDIKGLSHVRVLCYNKVTKI